MFNVARGDLLLRILVTALCLAVWRPLALVPVPGIDLHGAAPSEAVSVVALGLDPYAVALTLIVLVRVMSSTFNAIIRGGSIARYWRWEMLFIAAVAALGARAHIQGWQTTSPPLLPGHMDTVAWLGWVLALTGGALTLYGLGHVINFRGIGFTGYTTGPLLIYVLDILVRRGSDFARAVARHVPGMGPGHYLRYLLGVALAIGLVALTVAVGRAVRKIPVRAGRSGHQGGAEQRSLPFRLLASGTVVPVILANGLVYSPAALADVLASSPTAAVRHAVAVIDADWRPDGPLVAVDTTYLAIHAALIVAVVIFVAWFRVDPYSIARELQKFGGTVQRCIQVPPPASTWAACLPGCPSLAASTSRSRWW